MVASALPPHGRFNCTNILPTSHKSERKENCRDSNVQLHVGTQPRTYSRPLLGAHGIYWFTGLLPHQTTTLPKHNYGLHLLPGDGHCMNTMAELWLQMGMIISGTATWWQLNHQTSTPSKFLRNLILVVGPHSAQTTLPRARVLISPSLASPLESSVVGPTELLHSSSARRGWRHRGCSSQSPQHSSQESPGQHAERALIFWTVLLSVQQLPTPAGTLSFCWLQREYTQSQAGAAQMQTPTYA